MTPRALPYLLLPLCMASSAAAQSYGTQPTSQPGDGFQSGGVAPPPPMHGDPNQSQPEFQTETERKLDEAETEDVGRGLEWAYFNAEVGYQFLGLQSLSNNGLTYGGLEDASSGLMLGAGAGIRLLFYTIGARARIGLFDSWNLLTLNAEGGFHIPIGSLEPYFTLGGGYAQLGSLSKEEWGGDVTVRGWNARAGFGMDYYLTPVFSVGGNLTGEALFLSRDGVTLAPSSQLDVESQRIAEADGSGVGASFTGSIVLGLHF